MVFPCTCTDGSLFDVCLESEIKKIQTSARDHFQKIFNEHAKLKLQLESQKKELELRGQELEKREVRSENESRKLADEIEKVWYFLFGYIMLLRSKVFFCVRRISCVMLHVQLH